MRSGSAKLIRGFFSKLYGYGDSGELRFSCDENWLMRIRALEMNVVV